LRAATLGGAMSLGYDDRGFIEAGALADLVVLDAPSAAHLVYRPGANLASATIKRGIPVAWGNGP
jgi:imidazolonepropionase